jgi:hypothetical protein
MAQETVQEPTLPSKSFIKESAMDVRCPICRNLVREIVFAKDGGCSCLECFEASVIKKIWRALFPPPAWVVEFEKALDADTKARQELYAGWVRELTGGVQ